MFAIASRRRLALPVRALREPMILMLPSTLRAYDALRAWQGPLVVVSDNVDLLNALDLDVRRPLDVLRSPPVAGESLVCLTDQYLSPTLSPLLDTETGLHAIALEIVLAQTLSLHVTGWWPDAIRASHDRPHDIFALVREYYRRCELLGSAWLPRGDQVLRMPEVRRAGLKSEATLLVSSLLHSAVSTPGRGLEAELWQRARAVEARMSR